MHIIKVKDSLIVSVKNKLFIHDENSNKNQVIEIPSAELAENSATELINKSVPVINCMSLSEESDYIAISTETKQLIVYNTKFEVIKHYLTKRIPSKVIFSKTNDILVADKTGDVYLHKLEDKKSEPKLLLGHLSMILDMCLSECGKYLITCDRDEKIRVSHYPNTYNIAHFCLGHSEFVTALKTCGDLLFSASGDGKIGVWEFASGKNVSFVNTAEHIEGKETLETFTQIMDKEHVEVSVLPISDLQINKKSDDEILIAVQLYSYSGLQLYKMSISDKKISFWKTVTIEFPLVFKLATDLKIFDNSQMFVYNFSDDDITCVDINDNLLAFYKEYKDDFKIVDNASITMLYKRQFDNVKEYLERKKLRLEGHQ